MADEPSPPAVSRRARKAQATRDALRTAALDLFSRKGFAETTIRDITDAVDLADRTFYRYFDSKEDLLLDDVRVYFDAVEAWVAERPATESPMRSLIEWVLVMRDSFVIGEALVGAEFIDRNASAEGRMHQMLNDHQDRLALIFATRLGETGIPFVAHHCAAAAGAAFIQGLGRYLKNPAYSPWDYGLETLRAFSAGLDHAAVADIDPFVPVPEPLLPPPDRKTESGAAGG